MTPREARLLERLSKEGYEVVHNGMPDFMMLRDGQLVGIEHKSKKGHLTKAQIKAHDILRRGGIPVMVMGEEDDFVAPTDEIKEGVRVQGVAWNASSKVSWSAHTRKTFGRRLSQGQRGELRARIVAGDSVRQIARDYGLSSGTVGYYVRCLRKPLKAIILNRQAHNYSLAHSDNLVQ